MNKHGALRAMIDAAKIKHPDAPDVHFVVRDGNVQARYDDPAIMGSPFTSWGEMPADGYYEFTAPMTDDEIIQAFIDHAALCSLDPRDYAGSRVREAFEFCARVLHTRSLTSKESGQ